MPTWPELVAAHLERLEQLEQLQTAMEEERTNAEERAGDAECTNEKERAIAWECTNATERAIESEGAKEVSEPQIWSVPEGKSEPSD
jgi:type II secretory pathway component PulJ